MAFQGSGIDAWFSQRRFGLFLHFGLYALDGWHEQDQMRRRIPRDTYEALAARFNPLDWNPEAILDLAESVGMEYVCLTTKHHDGYCLWDTAQTPYQVMNSPCGRDLLRELSDACHARNFPLGLYYSVVDWHHADYPNQGRHHEVPAGRPGHEPVWDRYLDFLRAQVRELCTGYGPIAHWFWDMNVPEHVDPSINGMIRELHPGIVINDRGFDEGDFGTPEREYNEAETAGVRAFPRPTEACNSVGSESWGWREDEDYYSPAFLMAQMGEFMAKGGHYLLNVGPDATGAIPSAATKVLRPIGDWYTRVREAFADSVPASDRTHNHDVFCTARGDTLYVIAPPPWRTEALLLPPLDQAPESAVLLNTGVELEATVVDLPRYWTANTSVLRLRGFPKDGPRDEPRVIALRFARLPDPTTAPPMKAEIL